MYSSTLGAVFFYDRLLSRKLPCSNTLIAARFNADMGMPILDIRSVKMKPLWSGRKWLSQQPLRYR
jgi:hypothetical protein